MNLNEKTKKTLSLILKIAAWIVVAFTIFMMVFTIVSVTTVDKNDRSIFGIKFYIVTSDSMSKSELNKDMEVHFNAGDIILVKNVKDPTALKKGDIISFLSTNEVSYGETVTHMIDSVYERDGRVIGYYTVGTNTGTVDEALVEPEYVLGTYAGKLPGVGNFFAFVKSPIGYVICILIPFLLLIVYNGSNVIRLFRQQRKEQEAVIVAERAQISEERKQNEQMLRELQALKEQLAKQMGEEKSPETPDQKSEEPDQKSEE